MEALLQETIRCGLDTKVITRHQVKRVNVDTTVQEKAISFPTDGKLCYKMREKLVKEAKREGIELRQTYTRKSKRSLFLQFRFRHGRKIKKSAYHLRKLKAYLGRVLRDVKRKRQEKNIEFPTDSGLYYKALKRLVHLSNRLGIKLRQTY